MSEDDIRKLSDNTLIELCENSKIAGNLLGIELIKRFKSKNRAIVEALHTFKQINEVADEIIKEANDRIS